MIRPRTNQEVSVSEDTRIREIQDLALASFAVANGNRLVRTPAKQNGGSRKLVFCFSQTAKLEADILAFYNRTAKVDPLTFSEVFRNLKALTF